MRSDTRRVEVLAALDALALQADASPTQVDRWWISVEVLQGRGACPDDLEQLTHLGAARGLRAAETTIDGRWIILV